MTEQSQVSPRLSSVLERLKSLLGEKVLVVVDRKIVKVTVPPDSILEAAAILKENGFDHVKGVTGTDLVALTPSEKAIEVIYHAGSYLDDALAPFVVNLATKLDRNRPEMPSLTRVWPSAEYHERETYEMLGVIFKGHPNLKRLLLPEWWRDIPPLRKDYSPPGRQSS